MDAPLRISVTGLEPGERVRLQLRAHDDQRVGWLATSEHTADPDGAFIAGAELLGVMRPESGVLQARFVWPERRASTFTVGVVADGREVASTTFRRRLPTSAYRAQFATVADTGFAGVYLAPTGVETGTPVLLLGGGDGGVPLPLDAFLLPAHGHPVLALAYFGEQDLPATLSRIPLEYFENALRWLNRRPHADGRGAVVWGISRGSEAALLLGVHRPDLVRGVVALVPSNVSHCASPDCDGPAWTRGGRAIPFTREFSEPRPADDPRAVIPVEAIRAPVLAVCGGRDATWDSCAHAEALDADELLAYPRAGHGLGTLAPYQPLVAEDAPTHTDDQLARADAWPQVLRFLKGL